MLFKMHALYYSDVQNIQQNNRLIITQNDENQSFRVERPLGVCPALSSFVLIKTNTVRFHQSLKIHIPSISGSRWIVSKISLGFAHFEFKL